MNSSSHQMNKYRTAKTEVEDKKLESYSFRAKNKAKTTFTNKKISLISKLNTSEELSTMVQNQKFFFQYPSKKAAQTAKLTFPSIPKLNKYIIHHFNDKDCKRSLRESIIKMGITQRTLSKIEKIKSKRLSKSFMLNDKKKEKSFSLNKSQKLKDKEKNLSEKEVKTFLKSVYQFKKEEKLNHSLNAFVKINDYFHTNNQYESFKEGDLISLNNLNKVIQVQKILKKKEKKCWSKKKTKIQNNIDEQIYLERNFRIIPSNIKLNFKASTQQKFNQLRGLYL